MFLKHKVNGDLVEIINIEDLYDPCQERVLGRFHAGEEMQEPESFLKIEMIFPSGEPIPLCWLDPNYRIKGVAKKQMAHV